MFHLCELRVGAGEGKLTRRAAKRAIAFRAIIYFMKPGDWAT
jgi:hypothetical protein